MKCRVCGYELYPNRAYCSMCGTKVIASATPDAPIEKAPDVAPPINQTIPAVPVIQPTPTRTYAPEAYSQQASPMSMAPQQPYQPAVPQAQEGSPENINTSEFAWNVYDFPKPKAPGDIPIKWPEYDYVDPTKAALGTPDHQIQAAIDNKEPMVIVSGDASEGFVAVPDPKELAWKAPMDESTRRNEQFFTFQKKNEEFQRLLDKEYEKLQNRKEGETYREETFNMPQEDLQAQRNAAVQAAMQVQQTRNIQGFPGTPMFQQPQVQQQKFFSAEHPVQQAPLSQYMPVTPVYKAESLNEFERMLIDNTKDADLITGDTLPLNLEKIQEEVRAQEAARLRQNEEVYRAQQNAQYQAEQAIRSAALKTEMERSTAQKQEVVADKTDFQGAPHAAKVMDQELPQVVKTMDPVPSQVARSMNEERLKAMAKAREEYFQMISGLTAYNTPSTAIDQPLSGADGQADAVDTQVVAAMAGQAITSVGSQTTAAVAEQSTTPFAEQTGAAVAEQSTPVIAESVAVDTQVVAAMAGQAVASLGTQTAAAVADQAAAAKDIQPVEELRTGVPTNGPDKVSYARPEDKRTKASLETTSLEKPINDLFAPPAEEIKAPDKRRKPRKRHFFWKTILILILMIALAEASVVGMRKLIPESELTVKATEIEQMVITTAVTFGGYIKEFVTDALDKLGISINDRQDPEEEPLEAESALDLDEIVSTYNKNIQSITQSPTLVYESAATYEVEGLGDMAVVADDAVKEAIYACLISFNSKWVDYVNTGEDDGCLDLLKADGAAYRSALNFSKVGQIEEVFQSLMLGEMRMSDSAYYIFAKELIAVTESGKTTTKSYSWIYELEDVAGEMKIVDYTAF